MSIPFKLIFDKDNPIKDLPSDRRNIDIIRGVNFGIILGHIHRKNKNGIESWIKGYENKLTEYLNKKQNSQNNNDSGKYCTNLNYILDYIVQGIYNLNVFDRIRWTDRIENISMDTLLKYPLLNCKRNLKNSENKYLFFKKLMLDLCEDIGYFKTNKNNLINKRNCPKILARLQYRKETLMQFFYASYYKDMFDIKDECSISFINDNFSDISCNNVKEQSKTTGPSEGERVTASSSADRADQLQEGAIETGVFQASGDDDGLDDPGRDNPIPEDLEISLAFNEDPPKLDTTYAAASLAGISLFGTILYKYGPFRNRFNSRRGAISGSNIFPTDNHVYDANIMNNFEYLQTGIPNDEYQVGYGSVTDY
ncbi:Plasmodium vivax Vir protein, putative [Plasmodium vivax]|uniref:Vir protein, putative n=1 Tax=Plasmodium vivax TaxID=5855 RepID=A0A1G4EBE6_PLAVI|nr:Plasmodium vivax Vir protein, putative [Plasmodium vivax]